jgi:hypothetical protein
LLNLLLNADFYGLYGNGILVWEDFFDVGLYLEG